MIHDLETGNGNCQPQIVVVVGLEVCAELVPSPGVVMVVDCLVGEVHLLLVLHQFAGQE
jgi:hypothetical protein